MSFVVNYFLLQVIFFQGITNKLRGQIWPYLLHIYSFSFSKFEKQRIDERLRKEYEQIDFDRQVKAI